MVQKMKTIKNVLSIMMCIVLLLIIPMKTEAKEDLRLMQYLSTEDTLQLYVGGELEIKEVSGQVARTPVKVITTEVITDSHTIILIDNSLSITENNQKKIAAILEAYVNQKAPEEKISFAIYGEDITYLVERETDSSKVLEAVAGIVYENQDSYLTDILYDEIEKLNNKTEYTRFIVATDGMDDKAIGYTKDELTEKLKEEKYPIYVLGCVFQNNTSELENLFSIARLTNSNYFLLDDYEEYTDIVSGLNETVQKIIFEVPEDYRNGSEQSVLITLETDNGTIEISDKFAMPFQIEVKEEVVEKTIDEEPVVEKTIDEEPVVEEAVVEESAVEGIEIKEPTEGEIDFITIGAIALIVILLVVVLIMNFTKKKKEKAKATPVNNMYQPMGMMPPKGQQMPPMKRKMPPMGQQMPPMGQQMPPMGQQMPPMGQQMPPMGQQIPPMGQLMYEEEEKTVLLNNNIKTLNMRDISTGKVFSYPVSAEGVVIGRNRSDGAHIAINYNASISRKHCRITAVGSRNFVEDLSSLNGVFVNGKLVQGRVEFRNGDVIKMGDVEMETTIS